MDFSAFMGNFETAILHKIRVICKNIERQWILLEGQLLVDREFLYIRGKFRSEIFHKIRYITVNCGIYGKFQDAKKYAMNRAVAERWFVRTAILIAHVAQQSVRNEDQSRRSIPLNQFSSCFALSIIDVWSKWEFRPAASRIQCWFEIKANCGIGFRLI